MSWDVLGIGASLLGGLLGNESREDTNAANLAFSREQQAQNIELQKEFAQKGIQWRVADAKAAGVHPMYALGGSGAAFSPNPVVMPFEAGGDLGRSLQEVGQDISRSVSARESDEQRALRLAQIKKLEAESANDLAQSQYWSGKAKREELENGVARAFPVSPYPTIVERAIRSSVPGAGGSVSSGNRLTPYNKIGPGISGHVNLKGADQLSSSPGDPSTLASRNPGFEEHVITPWGLKFMLPRSDEGPGETWGELSWYDKLGLLGLNIARGGPGYTGRLFNEFMLHQAPKYRQYRKSAPERWPEGVTTYP